MWCDYIKAVQNLEKYTINFSYWVKYLGKDLKVTYYVGKMW